VHHAQGVLAANRKVLAANRKVLAANRKVLAANRKVGCQSQARLAIADPPLFGTSFSGKLPWANFTGSCPPSS
jgi:hypothetical protein